LISTDSTFFSCFYEILSKFFKLQNWFKLWLSLSVIPSNHKTCVPAKTNSSDQRNCRSWFFSKLSQTLVTFYKIIWQKLFNIWSVNRRQFSYISSKILSYNKHLKAFLSEFVEQLVATKCFCQIWTENFHQNFKTAAIPKESILVL